MTIATPQHTWYTNRLVQLGRSCERVERRLSALVAMHACAGHGLGLSGIRAIIAVARRWLHAPVAADLLVLCAEQLGALAATLNADNPARPELRRLAQQLRATAFLLPSDEVRS